MAKWATPKHSRTAVGRAGDAFVDSSAPAAEREKARAVINNWRSSHSYPLNTMQVQLRAVARRYDTDRTVAQRIKRLASIRQKLELEPSMNLAQMQDVGGCRAVVRTVKAVYEMADYYKNKSRILHDLIREDDYIQEPRESGYRSYHLVYKYRSSTATKAAYDGLRIEIQLRSRLQHAWATAVETAGLFTEQALKSSLGDPEWLRFFVLMSSALALRENTPLVPGTPEDPDTLKRAIRLYEDRLSVIDKLTAYQHAIRVVEEEVSELKGHMFLLELNLEESRLRVTGYDDPASAESDYGELERQIEDVPGMDAVLVTGESLETLRRAYPNYFGDTAVFVKSVREAIT